MPRQMRETVVPVEPNLMNCMGVPVAMERGRPDRPPDEVIGPWRLADEGLGIACGGGRTPADRWGSEQRRLIGFGRGKDASLLYITAGASLYRIRVNREGYHLP